MNFLRLPERRIRIAQASALLAAGALAMFGYNHFEGSADASSTSGVATQGPDDDSYLSAVRTRTTFFPNGTVATNYIGDSGYLTTISSRCQGQDLLDQSLRSGGFFSRSPNHPACADGTLTPDDYPTNASNTNIIKK